MPHVPLPVSPLLLPSSCSKWTQRQHTLQQSAATPCLRALPHPHAQADTAFGDDMVAACQLLLEDREVRVRWAVSATWLLKSRSASFLRFEASL